MSLDEATHVHVDLGEDGKTFKKCFIAWGASLHAWQHLKPVLVLDGAHLTPQGTGILLVAVGSDAENHIVPLAMGLVPTESCASWMYFLGHLLESIPTLNQPATVVKSDRGKGLIAAVQQVLPEATHVWCIQHLIRNATMKLRGVAYAEMSPLIYHAARARLLDQFHAAMASIKEKYEPVAAYLNEIPPIQWCEAFLKVPQWGLATSNNAESLNSLLLSARHNGPLACFIKLRSWLFENFASRRIQASLTTRWSPLVEEHLQVSRGPARCCTIRTGVPGTYEVTQGNTTFALQLGMPPLDPCSCRLYSQIRVPCIHMIAVLGILNHPLQTWIGSPWLKEAYEQTYSSGSIKPLDYDFPINIEVTAPDFKPTGSRVQKRFASKGEVNGRHSTTRKKRTLAGAPIRGQADRELAGKELFDSGDVSGIVGEPNIFEVASGSSDKMHRVDMNTGRCDCKDAELNVCKHLIAVRHAQQLQHEQQTKALEQAQLNAAAPGPEAVVPVRPEMVQSSLLLSIQTSNGGGVD
jgi:hypothetical protein